MPRAWPFCSTVYPWFLNSPPRLTGTDDDVASDKRGCDGNCYMCDSADRDTFASSQGSNAHGSRFMRPSDNADSRSASGRYDWPSGDARVLFIPYWGSFYELSMCYLQSAIGSALQPLQGEEFWDEDICSCLVKFPGPGRCDPPVGGCLVSISRAVSVFLHRSKDWPPDSNANPADVLCTGQSNFGRGKRVIRWQDFRQGSPGIIRLSHSIAGEGSFRPSTGCSIHRNGECTGREVSTGACPQVFTGDGTPPHLNRSGEAQIQGWNFLEITELSPSFTENNGEPLAQREVTRAKNHVLSWIADNYQNMPPLPGGTSMNLNQLRQDTSVSSTNHDTWTASWNPHPAAENIPLDDLKDLPGALDIANVREVRADKDLDSVKYTPWEINLTCVAQWMNFRENSPCQEAINQDEFELLTQQIYPQVKFILEVKMALYGVFEFAGTNFLTKNPYHPVYASIPESGGPGQPGIWINAVNFDSHIPEAGDSSNGAGRWLRIAQFAGPSSTDDFVRYIPREEYILQRRQEFISGTFREPWPELPARFVWEAEMNLHRDKTPLFDLDWVESEFAASSCCGIFKRLSGGLKVRSSYDDPIWPEAHHGGPSRSIIYNVGQRDAVIESFRTTRTKGHVKIASSCLFGGDAGCNGCDDRGGPQA